MNTKKIITIIIIVIALGGAIFLGYSAMTSNTGGSSVKTTPAPAILPLNTNLDFKPINDYNSESRFFPYPQVNTSEIGVTNSTLVP
jgi:hypothetical protein